MTISRSQMRRQLYQSGGITSIEIEKEEMPEFNPMDAVKALARELQKEGLDPREALITALRMIEVAGKEGMETFEDEDRIERAMGGLVDREDYLVGGIVKSISKAVKGVAKGVTGAVKGVAKAVKNVATSDFGKAALAAAALYFGGGGTIGGYSPFGGGGGFSLFGTPATGDLGTMTGTKGLFGNLGLTKGYGAKPQILTSLGETFGKVFTPGEGKTTGFPGGKVGLGILGASALAGLSAKQEEQPGYDTEARQQRVRDYLSLYAPKAGVRDPRFYATEGIPYPTRFAAEGGFMGGEPKKKGGIMEIDYRKAGGFVPIGVKEKADDVPAMLSKNEFVMTADAVRGAGGGDINKGAQRMYDTMKKLEAKVNG